MKLRSMKEYHPENTGYFIEENRIIKASMEAFTKLFILAFLK